MATPGLELDAMPFGSDRRNPNIYLKKFEDDTAMVAAYDSIPQAEIDHITGIVRQHYPQGKESQQHWQARMYLKYVYLRAVYAMCNVCKRSSLQRTLRRCRKCHITYWCDPRCYAKDTDHIEWCSEGKWNQKHSQLYYNLIPTSAFRDLKISPAVLHATLNPTFNPTLNPTLNPTFNPA